MKLKQLSVFVENKPGRLAVSCRALADAGVNILTLSLADTQQFGILRLIVRDWERAKAVLEQAGCVVRMTEVVAIEMVDKPGALADTLVAVGQAGLNVEYLYAFTFKRGNCGVLVFRFDDPDKAIEALGRVNIQVIASNQIYDLLESGREG
jgi:hypothetical protein